MQVKSIAEYSKRSILQYVRPSLSYHLSLRSLFCLFLSSRFTQVYFTCHFFFKESEHEGDGETSKGRKRKSSEGRGISPIEWDREESEAEKSDNEGGSDHESGGEEDEAKGSSLLQVLTSSGNH